MRIYPREMTDGVYLVPSDKYSAHLAIILASVAKGKTTVFGRTDYPDIACTLSCVKKLGAKVKRKGDAIEIKGVKTFKEGTYRFDCGNSGTTMRLMCGVSAGAGIEAVLTGGKYLSKRNMKGVKEPLEKMGATVALTNYTVPPIWVEGAKLNPIECEDELSAQEKGAVLLAGLLGNAKVKISEKVKTNASAERLLKEMGADVEIKESGITLKNSKLLGGNQIYLAGDIHSASVLLAMGLLLGRVTVKNVGIGERKSGFLDVVKRMGGKITVENERTLYGERVADITAEKSKLKATHVDGEESKLIADDLPIIAVLMGVAEGESIIVDIGDFSDGVTRSGGISELINSLGGNGEDFGDGVRIKGVEKYRGGQVRTNSDHRIALAGAVALLASENGGDIDDENCVSVSFPEFFEIIKNSDVGVLGNGEISEEVCRMHRYILGNLGVRSYSVSRYLVSEDGAKRFSSEMRSHAGYSLFYPYSSEELRSVRKFSSASKFFKNVDAVVGNVGYSFVGNATLLALKFFGEDLSGKKVLVIGAGNASKSVIHALTTIKAQVSVYNEETKYALEISKKTKNAVRVAGTMEDGDYYAVVNATPLGAGVLDGILAGSEKILKKCSVAIDLVIGCGETPFVQVAKENGKKTIDGREVAFFSTYLSDGAFFGVPFLESGAFKAFDEYFKVKR